jgi:heat shock protein HslJ
MRLSRMTPPVAAPVLVAALAVDGCGVPGPAGEPTTTSSSPQAISSADVSLSAQGRATGSSAPPGTLALQLAGRSFVSTAARGHELASGSTIYMEFHEDGTVRASPGCNMATGAASWDADVLSVADMSITEIGCEKPLMDQDQWFTGLLLSGMAASLNGSELSLTGRGVILDLLDRRVADPDRPLVGTTWHLDGVSTANTATPCSAWATVTLRIDDTELRVFNGSTWLRAPLADPGGDDLSASSGTVHVVPSLAGERLDCTGDGKWYAELPVLGTDFDYTIAADRLRISGKDANVGLGLDFRTDDVVDPPASLGPVVPPTEPVNTSAEPAPDSVDPAPPSAEPGFTSPAHEPPRR